MADEHDQHSHLVHELGELLSPLFTNSKQAVYLYLDDAHKTCNEAFVKLLGYKSIQEWVDNEYPIDDVVEKDQQKGIEAYMSASENLEASVVNLTFKKQSGGEAKAELISTPIPYKGEVFVLNFINPK